MSIAAKVILDLVTVLLNTVPKIISADSVPCDPAKARADADEVRKSLQEFEKKVSEITGS